MPEYKIDKKSSPREDRLLNEMKKSKKINNQQVEEMIQIYLEEDFLEECMKKFSLKIIDEIDEDLKMMKVFLNDLLRPIIKQGCRSIA